MKKLICLTAIAAMFAVSTATTAFAVAAPTWNDELADGPEKGWEGRVFGIPDNYLCLRDRSDLVRYPIVRMEEVVKDDLGLALMGAEVLWSQERGEWTPSGSEVVCLNPQAVRNVIEALDTMLTILRQITDSPEP